MILLKNFYWVIGFCTFFILQINAQGKYDSRHEVKVGDTLLKLAKQYYRNPEKWIDIFNENKEKELSIGVNPKTKEPYEASKFLIDPNLIYPGQILVIPDVETTCCHYCDVTDEDVMKKMEGSWKIINIGMNNTFSTNNYLRFEINKDLKIYDREFDIYRVIGIWYVKDFHIYLEVLETKYAYELETSGHPSIMSSFVSRKITGYLNKIDNDNQLMEIQREIPFPNVVNISGQLYYNNKPLEGVTISGGGKKTTTDSLGNYTLRGVKNNLEVKFSKQNYKTTSLYIKDWKIQETVSLAREELPITSRIFSGQILNEKEKPAKGVKIILELNQQQFGPYEVNKDGTWQSEAIPFNWEQIESQVTYQVIYKKQEKIIEIPEILSEKVDLGKVIFEKQ